MKIQLAVLLSSLSSKWAAVASVVLTYFMPITGLLFLVGFCILLDTVTGIWKSRKLRVPVTSRGSSTIISKMLLYEITVVMFYLIDNYILNDIILQFFSVPLMLTKILSLILVSIEVMSINENYRAVKGLDLWDAMKNLFSRAKEIKRDINEIR